jgi:putative membrane protein
MHSEENRESSRTEPFPRPLVQAEQQVPWQHDAVNLLVRFIANACGLAVAAWIFSGITITGDTDQDQFFTLVGVSLIFGLITLWVRPVVAFLSCPLYVLTLGLMYFVVNALMLMLTSWIADKIDVNFHVDGFWTAVGGGIVIALVSWGVTTLLPNSH